MSDSSNSPLALSFEDALCTPQLLSQITVAAENQVRAQIAEHGNRALGLALAGAKFVIDARGVQVVFQGGIPVGAKLMRSAGKALPALVDGKTGRILKLGRVASKGRVVVSVAANAALVVVEAAHMISGHDNAKRIKGVERNVDRLVHAHESELRSKLEGVYRYSKELLHAGPDALTDEDRRELHRQCKELMELRARWRDDFRHRLQKIDPADPGFWNKVFRWRREEANQKSVESKAQETIDALEIVQMMNFSLALQMALAGSAGKMAVFQEVTLRDESRAWRSLAEFGRSRVDEIAGDKGTAAFRDFLNAIGEMAEFWEPRPIEPPGASAPKKLPPRTTSTRRRPSDKRRTSKR